MNFLPMARASGLGSLPKLLEERSGTPDLLRAFQRVEIPLEIVDTPKVFMPVRAMCDLFDHSARLVGDRCFGLEIGLEMTPGSFGKWLEFSAQARTLGDALRRAERTCHHQMTGARMWLDRRPDVSLWRYEAPGSADRGAQHTDHLIWPMIKFVRAKLGKYWNPEWVEVDYPRDPQYRLFEDKLRMPVRYNSRCLSVAIRNEEIDRSPEPQALPDDRPAITAFDVISEKLFEGRQEPVKSIFLVIALRLLDGETDIDGVAQRLGLGLQQLQRTLRREGTCYRDLLDRAKLIKARSLLCETNLSVTEVAMTLGYSDYTAFSRAFRRAAGCTPSQFRLRRKMIPDRLIA